MFMCYCFAIYLFCCRGADVAGFGVAGFALRLVVLVVYYMVMFGCGFGCLVLYIALFACVF